MSVLVDISGLILYDLGRVIGPHDSGGWIVSPRSLSLGVIISIIAVSNHVVSNVVIIGHTRFPSSLRNTIKRLEKTIVLGGGNLIKSAAIESSSKKKLFSWHATSNVIFQSLISIESILVEWISLIVING